MTPLLVWRTSLWNLIPIAATLAILFVLLARVPLAFDPTFDSPKNWFSVGLICVVCAIAVGTGYAIKRLLSDAPRGGADPPVQAGTTQDRQDAQSRYREALARYVVIAGTLGIGLTALLLLALLDKHDVNWPQSGLNIFSSLLAVFSTWVGTVLAFYFTNESFKQAAASSKELLAAAPGATASIGDAEPLNRPGTMVPYERIVRIELTKAQVGEMDAKVIAEGMALSDVNNQFQLPGIVRVVIFDPNRTPLFVVRHDLMPKVPTADDTLKSYLDLDMNRAAAVNFAFASTKASLNDGRRILQTRSVTDLFVTENGRADEPTIGWVPDDNLQLASTSPVPLAAQPKPL